MANTEHTAVSDATSVGETPVNVFANAADAGGNSRTLEFSSKNLGQDVDLLLMFQPPDKAGKLYVDLFPICWKVLSFTSKGTSFASVEYTAQTAFLVPQVNSGNLVAASNAQPCETGQRCSLKRNEKGNNYLTDAVVGAPKFLQCVNETGHPGDIGVGFYNDEGTKVEPALLWNRIANKSTLSVQLTPILKIYAVSDYKATELIRGDIETPLLWERNLIGLGPSTELNVSIDAGTGEVVITEL